MSEHPKLMPFSPDVDTLRRRKIVLQGVFDDCHIILNTSLQADISDRHFKTADCGEGFIEPNEHPCNEEEEDAR